MRNVRPYRKNKKARTNKRANSRLKANAKKATTVGAVKRVVKQVLNNVAETKKQVMSWSRDPLSLRSGVVTMSNNYVVLNPSEATYGAYTINRGDGDGMMTGDKVKVKSAKLSFVLTPNMFNASSNTQPRPFYLRAYLYKNKKAPQNDPQVNNICGAGIDANFFELGTTDIGFNGTLEDMNLKINRQCYTYYASKTYKLGNSVPPAGINNTTPNNTYSNNEFKLTAFGVWDVTKFFPKTLERSNDGKWQDDYLILLFQVVFLLRITLY